jgi:hypothetical protein
VKRKIYAAGILLLLIFMIMPPSLGATTEPYDPMDYLYEEEQAYVKSMRSSITEALSAIADANGEIGPFFTEGYEKWADGVVAKFDAVNDKTRAIGAIDAPDAFSAVQAQARGINTMNSDNIYNFLSPYEITDLANAMQSFSKLEGSLNTVRGQVQAVSSALEGKAAELAKKNKMGADIIDSILGCESTAS